MAPGCKPTQGCKVCGSPRQQRTRLRRAVEMISQHSWECHGLMGASVRSWSINPSELTKLHTISLTEFAVLFTNLAIENGGPTIWEPHGLMGTCSMTEWMNGDWMVIFMVIWWDFYGVLRVNSWDVLSGKRLHNYGKSPCYECHNPIFRLGNFQ